MSKKASELHPGARVRIVDEPNHFCDAGWADEMNQYCGKEAVITRVTTSGYYKLNIDHGVWNWSSDIITPSHPDIPLEVDEAVDIYSLFQ